VIHIAESQLFDHAGEAFDGIRAGVIQDAELRDGVLDFNASLLHDCILFVLFESFTQSGRGIVLYVDVVGIDFETGDAGRGEHDGDAAGLLVDGDVPFGVEGFEIQSGLHVRDAGNQEFPAPELQEKNVGVVLVGKDFPDLVIDQVQFLLVEELGDFILGFGLIAASRQEQCCQACCEKPFRDFHRCCF